MCVPNPSTLTVEGKDLIKLRCIFMSPHALTDRHAVNVRSQQLSVMRINGLLYNMVLGPPDAYVALPGCFCSCPLGAVLVLVLALVLWFCPHLHYRPCFLFPPAGIDKVVPSQPAAFAFLTVAFLNPLSSL